MDPACSSFSGPEAFLRSLLEESFDCLEREIPQAYERICASLEGLSICISLDDETVVVRFTGTRGRVDGAGGVVQAELCSSRRAVLAVLDGRLSFAEAVLTDAVRIKAPMDTLERLNRALEAFMQGAVRSRSFPALLARLRSRERPESGRSAPARARRGRVGP